MVITNHNALATRLRMTKGQGQSLTRRHWHEMQGFSYRMTNITVAIGLGQIERPEDILQRKWAIAALYRQLLAAVPVTFQLLANNVHSSDWLASVLLPPGTDREQLMLNMDGQGVKTRPVFFCAHTMPMHQRDETLPIAEDIARRGISVPSYPHLSAEDVARVVLSLREALHAQDRAVSPQAKA
jgi:perosamine synthetase